MLYHFFYSGRAAVLYGTSIADFGDRQIEYTEATTKTSPTSKWNDIREVGSGDDHDFKTRIGRKGTEERNCKYR